jgi:hypothetical protein
MYLCENVTIYMNNPENNQRYTFGDASLCMAVKPSNIATVLEWESITR